MVDLSGAQSAVAALLRSLGLDPSSAELANTPGNVAGMYAELFSGVDQDPVAALGEPMQVVDKGDLVFVRGLEVRSVCEHHLLPFLGKADIVYAPNAAIAGLGRFARLIRVLGDRPQLQERLTAQIAETIQTVLQPAGVFVKLNCAHGCVRARGERQVESTTVTVSSLGSLSDPAVQAGILATLGDA